MRRTFAVLVLAMASGLLFPAAASAGQNPGTAACSLSQAADGNLVVTVTGLAPGTDYSFYVDAPLPDGTVAAVVDGGFITDATGSAVYAIAPVLYLMGRYPGETYLVFDLYAQNFFPRHGNRDHVLASCTFTPA